jgi:hypothetical protein
MGLRYEAPIPPQKKVIGRRQTGCPIGFVVDTHRAKYASEREF